MVQIDISTGNSVNGIFTEMPLNTIAFFSEMILSKSQYFKKI